MLKKNGELHIADMGKPQNLLMHIPSVVMGRLEENDDNVKGLLLKMLTRVGFSEAHESFKLMTVFGTISFYKGLKP